jgi:hypothetical protein
MLLALIAARVDAIDKLLEKTHVDYHEIPKQSPGNRAS